MKNNIYITIIFLFTVVIAGFYLRYEKSECDIFFEIIALISISFIVLFYFINKALSEKIKLTDSIKRKTKKLVKSGLKMKEYIKLIDENIITSSTDLNGNITYASEAFCEISGYSKEELMGKSHNIIRDPGMPQSLYKNLWDTIKANKVWKGEIRNIKKNGDYYWVYAVISPNLDKNGNIAGYTSIRQNITDKKYVEEISITDGLTNIFNRRHFDNIFPKILNGAKRDNDLVSFLIIDIDCFKQYNDTYGHQMGDDVLVQVAISIKNTLKRADDYCFRLGGEEFAVVFKVDRKEQALIFANTIKENIQKLKIEHCTNVAGNHITASMGLVCKNAQEIKNTLEIYKQADDLLYKAKNGGRNKVAVNG